MFWIANAKCRDKKHRGTSVGGLSKEIEAVDYYAIDIEGKGKPVR